MKKSEQSEKSMKAKITISGSFSESDTYCKR